MRVLNADITDGSTSWFPGTDGIGYWKEGDPTLTNVNPDILYNQGKLVGWLEDVDGSGTVLDNLTDIAQIPKYYLSCSSMPQITVDASGIYMVYKSYVETMQSGAGQFFSHLYGKASYDGGATWCNSVAPSLSNCNINPLSGIDAILKFEPPIIAALNVPI
jgi:hypothetical protein